MRHYAPHYHCCLVYTYTPPYTPIPTGYSSQTYIMILLEVSSSYLVDNLADIQSHNTIIKDVLTDRFEK
jgi:hypothetical protein